MREIAEFRVLERFAPRLFSDDEGKRLGTSIRKIDIATDDPRYPEVGRIDRDLQADGDDFFFSSWCIRRKYTKAELDQASLFRLGVTSIFQPASEECGMKYDESSACPVCGAGAKQIGPLILPTSRIPKGKDIASTIANEIVVSRRVVDLFKKHAVTGPDLRPMRTKQNRPSKDWFQLSVPSCQAEIIPPTRVGINPFDEDPDGQYRCERGDMIGLNLLSEVTISSASRGDADVVASKQYVGTRRGLLRPHRVILVSPKVRRLIESERLRGVEIDVAYVT